MTRCLLPLILLFAVACEGEPGPKGDSGDDGTNGVDGTNGTNGDDGTNGTDGTDGTDGENGPCVGRDPVDITSITGGEGTVYTNYPVEVDIYHRSDVPLSYSIAGFGVEYTFDGDKFEANVVDVNAGAQILVGTDGCTIDMITWNPQVKPGVFSVDVVHLFEAEGAISFGISGDPALTETLFEGRSRVDIPWGPYSFDVATSDGTVLETTSLKTYEPGTHHVFFVYGDEGATSVTQLEADTSPSTDPKTQFRLTAIHAADGVGTVDLYDKPTADNLFDDITLGDDDTVEDAEIINYGFALDEDDDGTTDVDLARFDPTGLENDQVMAAFYKNEDGDNRVYTFAMLNDFDQISDLSVRYDSYPGAAIVSDAGDVADTITVTDCGDILDINLMVDVVHTYRSDILIDLEDPAATRFPLWERTFDSSDDVYGIFDATDGVDLTGKGDAAFFTVSALGDYIGTSANGDWIMYVEDDIIDDDGTWISWSLLLECGI